MPTNRISKNELFTDLPAHVAFETVWHVLTADGVPNVTIDTQQNLVAGFVPANLFSHGQSVRVSFLPEGAGARIRVLSTPVVPGTIDFGKSKRHAARLTDSVEALLNQGGWVRPAPAAAPEPGAVLTATPIASPTGEIATRPHGMPYYGHVGPTPLGGAVLQYGLISLICCQIMGPFNTVFAIKTLRAYGKEDPGDKGQVIIGLVCSVLGSVMFVAYWGLVLFAVLSR